MHASRCCLRCRKRCARKGCNSMRADTTLRSRYIALLRGVNVGRAKRIAMADLRKLVEDLGHTGVRTLLNSGNIVFDAVVPPVDAAQEIEAAIALDLVSVRACSCLQAIKWPRSLTTTPCCTWPPTTRACSSSCWPVRRNGRWRPTCAARIGRPRAWRLDVMLSMSGVRKACSTAQPRRRSANGWAMAPRRATGIR
jgi:hypothetical protein